MTEQFDEGVKEILMTILSLGATAYETNYILDVLKVIKIVNGISTRLLMVDIELEQW